MQKPTIGILAGMGPKSTAPFLDLVYSESYLQLGAINDIDFPPILIYSLPTPFFIDRPIDHALMQQTICEGLRRLEVAGVSFIAMPCNTAHAYFDDLQKCIDIPLLNIVDETLKRIPHGAKKVTLLGTRSTIDSGLFQQKLAKIGIECIMSPKWQQKVDDLILKVKSGADPSSIKSLRDILLRQFQESSVNTLLVVCTDLQGMFDEKLTIIDSSSCLANATIKFWKSNEKIP